MKTRYFCLWLVAVLLGLIAVNRIVHYLSKSQRIALASANQSCFGGYVVIAKNGNTLEAYDSDLNKLHNVAITAGPEGKLVLTALSPTQLDLPDKEPLRTFIREEEVPCQQYLHEFVLHTGFDLTGFALTPSVTLATTVRKLKDKSIQLTLQAKGVSRNFVLTPDVREMQRLRQVIEQTGAVDGFNKAGVSVREYSYVKKTLKLSGLVLKEAPEPPQGVEKIGSAIFENQLPLPPLCLTGSNSLGDEISLRTADRAAFSLTREFLTLEGKRHEFRGSLENNAVDKSTEMSNDGLRISIRKAQDKWTGTIGSVQVSLRESGCEKQTRLPSPQQELIAAPTVASLKCFSSSTGKSAVTVANGLAVEKDLGGNYRLMKISEATSDCPRSTKYVHGWERLRKLYGLIENKCFVNSGEQCTFKSGFEVLCGTETLPLFMSFASAPALVLQGKVLFTFDKHHNKFSTKLDKC